MGEVFNRGCNTNDVSAMKLGFGTSSATITASGSDPMASSSTSTRSPSMFMVASGDGSQEGLETDRSNCNTLNKETTTIEEKSLDLGVYVSEEERCRIYKDRKNDSMPYPYHISTTIAPLIAPQPHIVANTYGCVALTTDTLYEGELLYGIPNGKGRLVNFTLRQVLYEGEWGNGLYQGRGRLYSNNRMLYNGQFNKGLFYEGQYLDLDGSIYCGTYCNGHLSGRYRHILPSGIYYDGNYKNGAPHGMFTFYIANYGAMPFNFDRIDDFVDYQFIIYDDFLYFQDRNLKCDAIDSVLLFYFNGDIYIGSISINNVPMNGYYYLMNEMGYRKTIVGKGVKGLSIVDITSKTDSHVKMVEFVIDESI